MMDKNREAFPSKDYILQCFNYRSDGSLIWKARPQGHFVSYRGMKIFNAQHEGSVAGHKREDLPGLSYVHVTLRNKPFKAHRLVWIMHNGLIPEGMEIDHINHDGSDNRIDNLRLVDSLENKKNRTKQRNNTSGHNGVHWTKKTKRWRVTIQVNSKTIHLGYFGNLEEAISARLQANKDHNFYEGHGESSREITSLGIRVKGNEE